MAIQMKRNSKNKDDDLGAIIFSCRPRSVKDYMVDVERHILLYYINPFINAVFVVALLVFFLLCKCFGKTGPLKDEPVWFVFMFIFIGMGLAWGAWWYYISPKNDFLFIHEKGFRWKLKLCIWNYFPSSGTVLYEELEHIGIRPDFTEKDLDKKNSSASDNMATFILELFFPKGDMRLTLKNGKQRTVENIMKRFVSEDLRRFIEYIQNYHPKLLQDR